jgi:hypothetical protein
VIIEPPMERALRVRNGAVPDVRILGGRGRGGEGVGGWLGDADAKGKRPREEKAV